MVKLWMIYHNEMLVTLLGSALSALFKKGHLVDLNQTYLASNSKFSAHFIKILVKNGSKKGLYNSQNDACRNIIKEGLC